MNEVLTKAGLVMILVQQAGLSKHDALQLIEAFFESINLALAQGQDVKLAGFGNFRLRHKKARPGRNPKTGKSAMVSSRQVVIFQASQKLKLQLKTRAKPLDE